MPTLPADGRREPVRDCDLCPRLRSFLLTQRDVHPDWHNAPVATWYPPGGPAAVRLLIVGLAPGLKGANRTGRPFTGDYAGDLLYATLARHGFSRGTFDARPDDGLELVGTAVTNAVRCVPPQNKPVGAEVNTCRRFLRGSIDALPHLTVVMTLGKIAHETTVRAFGARIKDHPFRHGGESRIGPITIVSSYHCSRYNTNTGRLTEDMFERVFARIAALVEGDGRIEGTAGA